MTDWLREVEPLTLKGQIAVPYTWWAGDTASRFFTALRDEGKILGTRCPECRKVFVPARRSCSRCFVEMDQWVELPPEGVVEAFTIVRYAHPIQPAEPPFAYVLVKLDGADVSFLHIVKKDLQDLGVGRRVRAVFKEKRDGHILDIDAFEPVGEH
ncbi:MAG TPA: Zn-ribbon domain-containing OB-fold protein [Syntrophales bacterium]|nr:Zn-ribbon domain-containing OB-fold protein [Syntrophales bacterium]HOO00110.1 Zn-ribbon domain-containing OB-fold protein [Syntrophales bacterium]